jgi:predicted flavoprotein YhiN
MACGESKLMRNWMAGYDKKYIIRFIKSQGIKWCMVQQYGKLIPDK